MLYSSFNLANLILLFTFIVNKYSYHILKGNECYIAIFLRRSSKFIPYLLGLIYSVKFDTLLGSNAFKYSIVYFFIAVSILIVLIFYSKEEISIYYKKECVFLFGHIRAKKFVLEIYTLSFSAIFQELYYKKFVFIFFLEICQMKFWMATILASILFCLEHTQYATSGEVFDIKNYIAQFIMSSLTLSVFYFSGNLLLSMLPHIVFNIIICFGFFSWYVTSKKTKGDI